MAISLAWYVRISFRSCPYMCAFWQAFTVLGFNVTPQMVLVLAISLVLSPLPHPPIFPPTFGSPVPAPPQIFTFSLFIIITIPYSSFHMLYGIQICIFRVLLWEEGMCLCICRCFLYFDSLSSFSLCHSDLFDFCLVLLILGCLDECLFSNERKKGGIF